MNRTLLLLLLLLPLAAVLSTPSCVVDARADQPEERPVTIRGVMETAPPEKDPVGRYAPEQYVPKAQRDDPATNWLVPFRKCMDEHGFIELTHRKTYLVSPTRAENSIIVRNHSRVRGNGATIKLDPKASLWPHTDRGFVFATMPGKSVVDVWIDDVRFDLGGRENEHDVTLRATSIQGHQVRVTRCHFAWFRAGTRSEAFVVYLQPSWRRAWTEVAECTFEDAAPNAALWRAKFPDGIPAGTWIPELSLACATIMRNNKTLVFQSEEQLSGVHHLVPLGGFGCVWSGNVCKYQGHSRMVWIQRPDEDGWWTEMVDGGGNAHIRVP